MFSDIIVIGGGAAGLVAACSAARTLVAALSDARVTVLEKMPRPGRKIMITGKGRCNFTNLKDWNAFSAHIRTNPNFLRPSFYNFTPADSLEFFSGLGMQSVVERGDRAFPASHRASDVVDALVRACHASGVKIETSAEVVRIGYGSVFEVFAADGRKWTCSRLILATGGLSYPGTGSTGDGYRFAADLGHTVTPLFPSLTALVPKGYKIVEGKDLHIDRSTPAGELGKALCGIQLRNVGVRLIVEGAVAQSEFGDIDFTDGGIEGPVGFQLSRKAVKSMVNGSRVSLVLDLKPGVPLDELASRVNELWREVDADPRSKRLHEKEKYRILLGKLMPWDLIPAFRAMNPGNLSSIARCLKEWTFDIAGYVGYERAVVTAGGVSTGEIVAKTLESKKLKGLYFCGELMDVDSDTGGYNLHTAFASGRLAGQSAAKSLI